MNKQLSAVFLVLEINYSSFYKSSFGPSHDNGENVIKRVLKRNIDWYEYKYQW